MQLLLNLLSEFGATPRIVHLFLCLTLLPCLNLTIFGNENWPGYEGGGEHHNSSKIPINPYRLETVWQREFPSNDPFLASRNLALVDGKIAIIGAHKEGLPRGYEKRDGNYRKYYKGYLSILDARTGDLITCYQVNLTTGQSHNRWYPTGLRVDAADTMKGHSVTVWDPQSKNLYIRTGGDHSSASAYNLSSLEQTTDWIPAIPSFSNGNDVWEPERPNHTSFFAVDSGSDLVVVPDNYGHRQSSMAGLAAVSKSSGTIIKHSISNNGQMHRKFGKVGLSSPFAQWGAYIISQNTLYYLGPADDNNGDGRLGDTQLCADSSYKEKEMAKDISGEGSKRWNAQNPDQGLAIGAMTFELDEANESVAFTSLYEHRLNSPHIPQHGPADAESYLETDHFRRNKAFLVDDGGVWCVWQKSKNYGAELVYASRSGVETWPMGDCKGVRGQDVWPSLSLTNDGENEYIVYYAGNAHTREYLDKEPPFRPVACFGPEEEPLRPAQIAVFDTRSKSVVYTYDISEKYPSLPANLAQHYIDMSHMVCSGKWAYVGWLDTTEKEASLKLLAFDVTRHNTSPVLHSTSLGFGTQGADGYSRSFLEDLIAVDGQIHARVQLKQRGDCPNCLCC